MAANEEKERHIEELRRTMKKYRRVEEMIATTQGRRGTGVLPYFISNFFLSHLHSGKVCGLYTCRWQHLLDKYYFISANMQERRKFQRQFITSIFTYFCADLLTVDDLDRISDSSSTPNSSSSNENAMRDIHQAHNVIATFLIA